METKQINETKTYEVCLTRYPKEFRVEASSKEEAINKAKEQVDFAVWESEVEEVEAEQLCKCGKVIETDFQDFTYNAMLCEECK